MLVVPMGARRSTKTLQRPSKTSPQMSHTSYLGSACLVELELEADADGAGFGTGTAVDGDSAEGADGRSGGYSRGASPADGTQS